MRYLAGAVVVAAACLAVQAQAQASKWGAFQAADGSAGAGVQGADGSQLILKCDKPGKGEVYALVVTKEGLVGSSNNKFQMRDVELRFDAEPPVAERWRFYEQSAVAINKKPEATFQRFVSDLVDANQLRVRLNPERGRWLETSFEVGGAKDAVAQVFTACKDDTQGKV